MTFKDKDFLKFSLTVLDLESFLRIGSMHIWLSAGPAMKSYVLSEYQIIALAFSSEDLDNEEI